MRRVAVLITCAIVFVGVRLAGNDTPLRPVPSELATQVAAALADSPPGTAEKYSGWFRAIADTLNGDEPIGQLRAAWVKAASIIELPGKLTAIVKHETEPFELPARPNEAAKQRKDFQAVWQRLADACQELTH